MTVRFKPLKCTIIGYNRSRGQNGDLLSERNSVRNSVRNDGWFKQKRTASPRMVR